MKMDDNNHKTKKVFQSTVVFTVEAVFDLDALVALRDKHGNVRDGVVRDVTEVMNRVWKNSPVRNVEIDSVKADTIYIALGGSE